MRTTDLQAPARKLSFAGAVETLQEEKNICPGL
jgi:hypothetical protein